MLVQLEKPQRFTVGRRYRELWQVLFNATTSLDRWTLLRLSIFGLLLFRIGTQSCWVRPSLVVSVQPDEMAASDCSLGEFFSDISLVFILDAKHFEYVH